MRIFYMARYRVFIFRETSGGGKKGPFLAKNAELRQSAQFGNQGEKLAVTEGLTVKPSTTHSLHDEQRDSQTDTGLADPIDFLFLRPIAIKSVIP